jgi:hypothetical protein
LWIKDLELNTFVPRYIITFEPRARFYTVYACVVSSFKIINSFSSSSSRSCLSSIHFRSPFFFSNNMNGVLRFFCLWFARKSPKFCLKRTAHKKLKRFKNSIGTNITRLCTPKCVFAGSPLRRLTPSHNFDDQIVSLCVIFFFWHWISRFHFCMWMISFSRSMCCHHHH